MTNYEIGQKLRAYISCRDNTSRIVDCEYVGQWNNLDIVIRERIEGIDFHPEVQWVVFELSTGMVIGAFDKSATKQHTIDLVRALFKLKTRKPGSLDKYLSRAREQNKKHGLKTGVVQDAEIPHDKE